MSVVIRFLWFLLFFHGYAVAQLSPVYYTKKEEQVRKMAAEILKLDGVRCDWAANCSSTTCSRHACTPIGEFKNPSKYNFTCQQHDGPNQYCSSSTRSCNSRQVNYAMSYVRMAPDAKPTKLPDEMCSTICMTRDFTSTMRDLASEKNFVDNVYEFFFFGSVDGVFRIYPGEEMSDQANDRKCYNYDPRKRIWYNGAISLQTYLIVLIDNSRFANSQTNSPSRYSALEQAKEIVKKFIYTVSADDMLDVITFNETNATSLTESPVTIQDDTESGEFQDGRKNLVNSIKGIQKATDSSVASKGDGFKRAISIALQRMKESQSNLNTVILVFTNGRFASNLQLADLQPVSTMLKSNSTKLFIYSFEESSNLHALANEYGRHYENIVDNFNNPLYQISSFFNFMARARNALANEPHWTKFYKDFENHGNIITVSYQALSPDGHLVGVVGIDIIFKSEQENPPPKAGSRPKLNADIDVHTKVPPTNNNCTTCNAKEAICAKSTKKTFIDLECCGCNPESHKWSRGKLVAAIGVPLVVVLAIIISVVWWVRRRKRRGIRIQKPLTTELGPYE